MGRGRRTQQKLCFFLKSRTCNIQMNWECNNLWTDIRTFKGAYLWTVRLGSSWYIFVKCWNRKYLECVFILFIFSTLQQTNQYLKHYNNELNSQAIQLQLRNNPNTPTFKRIRIYLLVFSIDIFVSFKFE